MAPENSAKKIDLYRNALIEVKEMVRKYPSTVLELYDNGNDTVKEYLPMILDELLQAGEIVPLGHTVYSRVPWNPAGRAVMPAPVKELIYAFLTRVQNEYDLSVRLNIPEEAVRKSLLELVKDGLVIEKDGNYRIVSKMEKKHIIAGSHNRL